MEENIRSRKVYLCTLHRSIKGLWHIKPWFTNFQVRSLWIWNRRIEVHEKLFNNRKEMTRANKKIQRMGKDNYRMPQGSIGPLLFKIFLNHLFYHLLSNSPLNNSADDNTLYIFGDNLKIIKNNLRNNFDILSHWFCQNRLLLNAGKYHFMCLGNNTEIQTFIQ